MNATFHRSWFGIPLAVLLLVCVLLGLCGAELQAASKPPPKRGGQVGWARLYTPSRWWNVHSDHDEDVITFIRDNTTLNMAPECFGANPLQIDDLCQYPLIFTNNLADIRDPRAHANIAEYLRRGGFLYIDACANGAITGDTAVFLRMNCALLQKLVPECRIVPMPLESELYRCYFMIKLDALYPTESRESYDRKREQRLYGVYSGQRQVAIISFSNVLCGWPQNPERIPYAMQLIVNLYVHSMTR